MKIENEYDNIFRYALYHTNCREDAEDITQETFLKYLKHPEYHERGAERQILYTIARNLCHDLVKRTVPESIEDKEIPQNEDILTEVSVRVAMSKLSEDDREIMILRYVNGENISVIAKLFGMSRFRMSRRITAITQTLKEELGKEELL